MYIITMINRNGYEIKRTFKTIAECKSFAAFYPLSVFFAWIYNAKEDKMCYQNNRSDKWKRCNNDTFVPYW